MLSVDRQQSIYDYIREHHSASVAELSKRFFISETSIRRDLQKLERSGYIHKTYGGAVLIQGSNEIISLDARQQVEKEAKSIIAKKASSLIKNGDVIFLDSSSTALTMVPYFSSLANLSVFTNSLRTASALSEYPHIKVYVLGGLLNCRTYSLGGTITAQQVNGIYADYFFVSPKGVDINGNISCAVEDETHIRQVMMQHSDHTVLLCCNKKLGQHAAFRLCGISDISTFVCEDTPDQSWLDLIKSSNVNLL